MAARAMAGLLTAPAGAAAAHAAPGIAGIAGALAFMTERGMSLARSLPALIADGRRDVTLVVGRLNPLPAAAAWFTRYRDAVGSGISGRHGNMGEQFISACSIHLP